MPVPNIKALKNHELQVIEFNLLEEQGEIEERFRFLHDNNLKPTKAEKALKAEIERKLDRVRHEALERRIPLYYGH